MEISEEHSAILNSLVEAGQKYALESVYNYIKEAQKEGIEAEVIISELLIHTEKTFVEDLQKLNQLKATIVKEGKPK